ncbi:MAG TPA: DUF5565 family protein [Flavobacteriales bacterium]|nr:DUF5565 family protein [Flavobacteriales bacterium]
MKKISTLFKKDPTNLARIINEVNPENAWVLHGEGIATRKFDGTSVAIIGGELFKRYDVKKGREVPAGAIACQEPDEKSGHHPHWLKCVPGTPEDKYFFEAFDKLETKEDGTYELCGPKVQGNPEKLDIHKLVKHGSEVLELPSLEFEELKNYLSNSANNIEGIVFHHTSDGRMCKLRKKDFGIKR